MGVTCNKSGSALESRAARRRPRKGGHNTQNRNDTYPGWQGKSNGVFAWKPTGRRPVGEVASLMGIESRVVLKYVSSKKRRL